MNALDREDLDQLERALLGFVQAADVVEQSQAVVAVRVHWAHAFVRARRGARSVMDARGVNQGKRLVERGAHTGVGRADNIDTASHAGTLDGHVRSEERRDGK